MLVGGGRVLRGCMYLSGLRGCVEGGRWSYRAGLDRCNSLRLTESS